jgi:hypothetical protein
MSPTVRDQAVEREITLHDNLGFVEKQDVAAGESPIKNNWAYRIEGPEGYVIFIQAMTVFAPEFRSDPVLAGDPAEWSNSTPS